MHTTDYAAWQHDHTFGQDRRSRGERGTLIVTLLTAVFMVVEISAGIAYGSMALLADGLHMASHALALGIAAVAYVYARRQAGDTRFSFGTGKVNALGGFTGALLLAVFAVLMAWESVQRFIHPVAIVFDQAIAVAVLGLLVNGVSVLLLGVHDHDHDHDHGHGHDDSHAHDHRTPDHDSGHAAQDGDAQRSDAGQAHHDHNLRAAYLHVLADALTSFTAIFALLGGKYFGLNWLDPVMGVVGSLLVARWSWGLLRQTSRVLLDFQAPEAVQEKLRSAVEAEGDDRVVDLHVWSIAPGVWAASLTVVSHELLSPGDYKAKLPGELGLAHVTVEVHQCPGDLAAVR